MDAAAKFQRFGQLCSIVRDAAPGSVSHQGDTLTVQEDIPLVGTAFDSVILAGSQVGPDRTKLVLKHHQQERVFGLTGASESTLAITDSASITETLENGRTRWTRRPALIQTVEAEDSRWLEGFGEIRFDEPETSSTRLVIEAGSSKSYPAFPIEGFC